MYPNPCYNEVCYKGTSLYKTFESFDIYTYIINELLVLQIEPWHGISNNVVCTASKASDQPAHTLKYSMSVKLLTEHNLEFLSLKGGFAGSTESTLVKMPNCWKSRVMAQL